MLDPNGFRAAATSQAVPIVAVVMPGLVPGRLPDPGSNYAPVFSTRGNDRLGDRTVNQRYVECRFRVDSVSSDFG